MKGDEDGQDPGCAHEWGASGEHLLGRGVETEQWQEGDAPVPPPTPSGYTVPSQRRKQLSKHPPSQFRSSSAPAPCGKWQHQLLSLVTVNSSPWGDFLLLDKSTVAHRAQLRWGRGVGTH